MVLVAQTLHHLCRATAVALHCCRIFRLMFSQCCTRIALHPLKCLKKALSHPFGGGRTLSWPCIYHKIMSRYRGCRSYSVASRATLRHKLLMVGGSGKFLIIVQDLLPNLMQEALLNSPGLTWKKSRKCVFGTFFQTFWDRRPRETFFRLFGDFGPGGPERLLQLVRGFATLFLPLEQLQHLEVLKAILALRSKHLEPWSPLSPKIYLTARQKVTVFKATQRAKKGSEKVLERVLEKGSQKGSEKGVCCGFYSKKKGCEKGF